MRMHRLPGWLLLAAVAVVGCNRGSTGPAVEPDDASARIPTTADLPVLDWLNLSRAELAKKFEETLGVVEVLEARARSDRQSVVLLPKLYPAMSLPIFQKAQFSEKSGFSLPPYFTEGAADADLALHLARYADAEAAIKLAGGDASVAQKIQELAVDKIYPLEWTRLVALTQYASQLRLANGEIEGASELLHIHKQLKTTFDPKAMGGPIGSALLSNGVRALKAAGEAWREAGKTGLADDVNAAMANWGEIPAAVPELPLGASRGEVGRILPNSQGRTAAAFGDKVARAFDLLSLPAPPEGVDGLIGFFDDKEKLTELTVVYKARVSTLFPETAILGQFLADHNAPTKEPLRDHGVNQQFFTAPGLTYAVTVIPRAGEIGGLIRIGGDGGAFAEAVLPRQAGDFGVVKLGGTFEQARVTLAPELKPAEAVEITKAATIAQLIPPAINPTLRPELPPAKVVVMQRAEGRDLLAALTFRWGPDVNAEGASKLALPLWSAYGGARVEGGDDANGGFLGLVWEDGRSRLTLKLPHNPEAPAELTARDLTLSDGGDKKVDEVVALEREQRKKRVLEGKPNKRIARALDGSSVKLGMTRAEVTAVLPKSQAVYNLKFKDGVGLYFLTNDPKASFNPQQLFVRFGSDDKVAEIRLRYVETPRKGENGLLGKFTTSYGAPTPQATTWNDLWTDLPKQKPAPIAYRWLDDVTSLVLQRDNGGSEAVLRDCPADSPLGVELSPLEFVARGVDNVVTLGDLKADVLKKAKNAETAADGTVVLPQKSNSPYKAIVAYFENDKVTRILAFHRTKEPIQLAKLSDALQAVWSKDLSRLGAVRRYDRFDRRPEAAGQVLESLGFHDDRTRVRIFALDDANGPAVYTEWCDWPVAAKFVAAVKNP